MMMVALSFAAQPKRIYAYGLSASFAENVYTFSFHANETPTAGKLVFYDATSSEKVGETALENLVLGKNEVTIAAHQLPGDNGQQLNWAIELSAAAVTAIDALNDPSLSQFKFYLPQDVAVDNSPESDFFGRVYVANPGTGSGYVAAGISVYDQELNKLGDGYKATGHTISNRYDIHRLAVQPQTGKIYYAKTGSSTAIYELIPNKNGSLSDGGSSVNVISGVSEIKNANSLCFDENGLLWILNYANYVDNKTTGVIYSVDNKVATLFTKNDPNVYKWVSNDNAIAPDGLGGFWVAQYRANFDGFYVLSHVNKEGVLDFYINNTTNNTLIPTSGSGSSINASYRGHLAYYSKENMLAFGGADRVSLFTVKYDSDGKPTLTKFGETPSIRHTDSNKNIDGIAFDYAGNLYMASATREKLYVYTLPTANNTCEVPAKKASVVTKVAASATLYTVVTNVNDVAMGKVTGNAGTYEEGATATLTAEPTTGYQFVNWTVGEDTYTANPLEIVVNSDLTVTANFEAISYTITANVNKEGYGEVTGGGAYDYNTSATLTATANEGYEFVSWSNGSKANPLTITVKKDETITANFRAILAPSITLNALLVQDYSASIVGTAKRAIQNGENTIVLTHEADGTPHIYNVAHATNTVTEISQEGVVAVDSENAGDYLAISDIALTEDGKLVATNKIVCQSEDGQVAAGYKRGELRAYIWNDLAGAPALWFTSKMSSNWYRSVQGQTIAYKGTSTNGTLFATGVTASGVKFRYSVYNVIDGVHTDLGVNNSDYYHFTKGSAQTTDALGANYQLVASPLAATNWILDGELVEPFEIVDPLTFNTEVTANPTLSVNLGKKYNGASCLANYNEHHLMVAPYADGEGKLAGVKVLGITDGFATATVVETNTALETAVEATAAAATAYVDGEGDLTIYLWADAKVYTFTEKTIAMYTIDAIPNNGAMGTITGSGSYLEGTQVTITATPAEGYEFVNWTKDEEIVSTENPYTFTVTENVALVANFKLIPPTKYNVTVTAENGTVTGAGEYEEGAEATLTATAAEGYEFTCWTSGEDTVSTENPYKFTVTADVALVANFKLIPPTKYNVTVTAENGTVTGAGEYEEGAEATLTATAAEGYEFTCWTSGEDTVSTANPYKFTVTADLALVANFKKAITTITKTFDITQEEDTRKMGGTYLIYADDDYTLRIFGYNGAGTYQDDPTTEEDAAPMLFTPDYDDALNAVVVVTLDNENKKEVMQVTATSEDGSTIYNLTINIALPSYETYSLVATGVKAENGEVEGMPIISLKGEGLQNGEEKVPFDFMVFESAEGYMAEGTVGEIYVFSTVAEFFAENGEFNFMATMQDEESKYLFNVDINGTMAQPEVEIVVKEEVNVTLYNLTVDVQGTMAMVSAGTEELSFWLTLLQTENHYGDYTNDAFSNIWYGDDQLYAAYGEKHTYDVTDGKVNFVVSFITTPDAEGNVTKYNFTLYAGEKPSDPTALDNISIEGKAAKAIINGQLIIVKDGVQYNAQGAVVK